MRMLPTLTLGLFLLGLAGCGSGSAEAPGAASAKFTVEEERVVEKFKAETQPQWEKDLETAAGTKIALEIEWPSMAGDAKVWEYLWSVSALRCPIETIVATCGDPVGKKRFVAGVKKIVLRHDRTIKDLPDKPGKGIRVELKDQVLTITDNWALNHLMTHDVQPLIEKLL